jgi:8-oxo-dGTP diphosphatase
VVDRFRLVPAAYVYLLRSGGHGDEVLLQLRRDTGYMDEHWAAAAAGHVERGETAYDAARREAREETGVEVGELTFLTSMQRTQHAGPVDERIDFFFVCRAWTGEPRVMEPAKCAALDWFPVSGLPEPVVPHERFVLERMGTGIARYTTFGFTASGADTGGAREEGHGDGLG